MKIQGAFFMSALLLGLLCSEVAHALECELAGLPAARNVVIAQVYDGDTVKLGSGEVLRFAGINTPELSRKGQPVQPYAQEAKEMVQRVVKGGSPWRLVSGKRQRDRHGRLLGHLVSAQGEILERQLLDAGLAFLVVIPPDVDHAHCFSAAQERAQRQHFGVWSSAYWTPVSAADVTSSHLGFRRLRGVVTKVEQPWDLFIELDDTVVLRIGHNNLKYFPDGFKSNPQQKLMGQMVEVSGWLGQRELSHKDRALKRKEIYLEVGTYYSFKHFTLRN